MLHENFFTLSGNSRNSSEAATPSRMDMEHKSLYLVEELPTQRLATSLLKQVGANDPTVGRALYQNARQIELTGKLIINTNNCPNVPGDDTATWDRMILIPWDARYAEYKCNVDEKKWILPSNPQKMDHIQSLSSAFVTVCLNEIHAFYQKSVTNGVPSDMLIPVPEVVVKLCKKKREELFPLIPFIRKYIVPTNDDSEQVDIKRVFYAYALFMSRRRKKNYDSIDTFMHMLAKGGLETVFHPDQLETFVLGHKLTDEGEKMADLEKGKERISADALTDDDSRVDFFATFKRVRPASIEEGFAVQRKRQATDLSGVRD